MFPAREANPLLGGASLSLALRTDGEKRRAAHTSHSFVRNEQLTLLALPARVASFASARQLLCELAFFGAELPRNPGFVQAGLLEPLPSFRMYLWCLRVPRHEVYNTELCVECEHLSVQVLVQALPASRHSVWLRLPATWAFPRAVRPSRRTRFTLFRFAHALLNHLTQRSLCGLDVERDACRFVNQSVQPACARSRRMAVSRATWKVAIRLSVIIRAKPAVLMTEPSTPLMRQYAAVRRKNIPTALLCFSALGDFYEAFSLMMRLSPPKSCKITLTSRNKEKGPLRVPMCGVPHHAAEVATLGS